MTVIFPPDCVVAPCQSKEFLVTDNLNLPTRPKILDDYLTLCEGNNIRPIILLMPATEGYIKHYDRQRLDEFQCIVRQACRKHPSAIFLDSWQLRGLTDRDFYDVYHLNLQGAAKFCACLNYIIEQLDGKQ